MLLTSQIVKPFSSAELLMVCQGALGTIHSISFISSGGSTQNSSQPDNHHLTTTFGPCLLFLPETGMNLT